MESFSLPKNLLVLMHYMVTGGEKLSSQICGGIFEIFHAPRDDYKNLSPTPGPQPRIFFREGLLAEGFDCSRKIFYSHYSFSVKFAVYTLVTFRNATSYIGLNFMLLALHYFINTTPNQNSGEARAPRAPTQALGLPHPHW